MFWCENGFGSKLITGYCKYLNLLSQRGMNTQLFSYNTLACNMETASPEAAGLPKPGAVLVQPNILPHDASEPVDVGTKCAVKNLYEGPVSYSGQFNWVDTYPDDLGVVAESAETAQYALLIRNRRTRDNSKKLLKIDSLVVQSPFLKSALGPVMRNYPGITTELERLTFIAPFQPLIHRWDDLEKAVKDEQDPVTKQHLDLFFCTLHAEIKDTIAEIKDVLSHNVITFHLLWAIFRPGDLIFTLDNGKETCFQLNIAEYGTFGCARAFLLQLEQIDWSGTTFGRSSTTRSITSFDGTKPIIQLQQFPFPFHPDKEAVRERLISRGRRFQELKGYHYKSYEGLAIGSEMRGGSWKFNVSLPSIPVPPPKLAFIDKFQGLI